MADLSERLKRIEKRYGPAKVKAYLKSIGKNDPRQKKRGTLDIISERKGTLSEADAIKKGKDAAAKARKGGKTVKEAQAIGYLQKDDRIVVRLTSHT